MENKSSGKKLTKSASGLRMIPLSDTYACPFALSEPEWSSDNAVTTCESCEKKFDIFKRKHHCRRCGKCFCSYCCHYEIPLRRMYFVDPVRHCYECAVVSKAEAEFYEKTLKILQNGEGFSVYNSITQAPEGKYKCRLSNDNRYLQFSAMRHNSFSTDSDPPQLLLSQLISIELLPSNVKSSQSSFLPLGVVISCKDEEDSARHHQLQLASLDVRAAAPWLLSLKKATNMVFESKRDMSIIDR